MADNYLEKKMEEHARGMQRRYTPLTPAGQRPGTAVLPFDVASALIWAPSISATVEAVAKALRATGCRVAIGATDSKGANEFAQKAACKYYPGCYNAEVLKEKVMADRSFGSGTRRAYITISDCICVACDGFECNFSATDAQVAAHTVIYALLPMTRNRAL